MKVAIVGHGKMGVEIAKAAQARGHLVVATLDRGDALEGARGAEVAFEFTEPSAAGSNVTSLLRAGQHVVCGTTGWDPAGAGIDAIAREAGRAAVVAPNFSIGVNLFFEIVAEAARRLSGTGLYDPWLFETHHRQKLDAPSGTAKKLAGVVDAFGGRRTSVAAARAGFEPGHHEVGFDGEHDAIVLTHRARGRAGFAAGAVLAAEWARGKSGLHGFEEVLADLVKGGGR
ncbi:MAG TPA: dihydrodipicolinate reductase C-terminal domain-containing protein [Candidatus Polarisedimenticolaceae bacterium]